MELLVAGRERIYLERFWNDISLDPRRFDEAKRQHYASLYAMPGAIRAGFAHFAAFGQDVIDNKAERFGFEVSETCAIACRHDLNFHN
jgi:hypothetical protein